MVKCCFKSFLPHTRGWQRGTHHISATLLKEKKMHTPNEPVRSIQDAKHRAKALRSSNPELSHAQSLEAIAQHMGHRDWNTAHASLPERHAGDWTAGQRLTGRYLSQAFTGVLKSIEALDDNRFRMDIAFDHPVDVVTSDRFQNLRSRVRATVRNDGRTEERTSDGTPHLVLDL